MTDYAKIVESTFTRFGVDARVTGSVRGPSVTRYEISLGRGVKVGRVSSLRDELTYAAGRPVRVTGPIPGKSAVGIEIPNDARETVHQSDIPPAKHPLDICVGRGIDGEMVIANLGDMPHLLVAGTTSSGKSSFINSALVSLLKADPSELQLVLVDPKHVELSAYEGVAHLRQPIITEVDDAVMAMKDLCDEVELRYRAMKAAGRRSIEGLGFPYIIVVVDELADLIAQAKVIEQPIQRIAQKARAAGVHLILSTQKPTADVLSSVIKSNCPSRLSFAVSSASDSRVILDQSGAETLLGKGDGLFRPIGAREAIRIQGALVTDEEIAEAVKQATVEPSDRPTMVIGSLDGMIAKAERAEENAGQYLRWMPSSQGLHESQAVTRLTLELDQARRALAELTDQLKAMKGMEAVA